MITGIEHLNKRSPDCLTCYASCIRMPESLNATDEDDAKTMKRLREVLGDFFAEKLYGDKDWTLSILCKFA